MANLDTFSASVICRYGNGTYTNIVYGQILDEANPGTALTGWGNTVVTHFVKNLVKTVTDRCTYDAVVVRRLEPAITDVEVLDINETGDLPQAGLPGTSYCLLRYFATPYEKGTAFHWKLTGLPHDANKRGIMTEQAVARYADLIEGVTLGPYLSDNNTYAFIRPRRKNDPGATALPTIYKGQTDNTIRNLRTRQVRL